MNRKNKELTENEVNEILEILKEKYPERNFKHYTLEFFVDDTGFVYGSRLGKDDYKSKKGDYRVLAVEQNKQIKIHRIVYWLFGEFEKRMSPELYFHDSKNTDDTVHHISTDKADNNINNLYYFDDFNIHQHLHRMLDRGYIKLEDVNTKEKLDLFVANYKATNPATTPGKNKK